MGVVIAILVGVVGVVVFGWAWQRKRAARRKSG
jgi:nitrogen fixation-related uncharacterized protein